jgi:transgelin
MDRNELPIYGLDKALSERKQLKLHQQNEQSVRNWFDQVFQQTDVISPTMTLQQALKDGVILCDLMNRIVPGSCKPTRSSSIPFHHMENISQFLRVAVIELGCKKTDLFQTVELYENRDMVQVINSLYSVARHARARGLLVIPALGPEVTKPHHVEFNENVLASGKTVLSPQMGYTGGANQSGISYGSRRQIDAKVA